MGGESGTAAYVYQLEAERFYPAQQTVERRLVVDGPGEHGLDRRDAGRQRELLELRRERRREPPPHPNLVLVCAQYLDLGLHDLLIRSMVRGPRPAYHPAWVTRARTALHPIGVMPHLRIVLSLPSMAAPDVRVNSRRVPRVVMGFMVVVTALVVGISATGLWMRGVVFRESRWKQTIAPLGSDDEVQAALAAWAGTEIRQVIDVKPYLEDILPSGAQGLASPLSFAIEGFIAERAASFFESDQFSELWERSTVRLHSAVLKVLRGDSEAVSVRDGQVVLNLVPILNQVLASISDELSQLLNRDINLPQIDPNTPASEAIERLSSALGRELPDDFGQIVVFDSD